MSIIIIGKGGMEEKNEEELKEIEGVEVVED